MPQDGWGDLLVKVLKNPKVFADQAGPFVYNNAINYLEDRTHTMPTFKRRKTSHRVSGGKRGYDGKILHRASVSSTSRSIPRRYGRRSYRMGVVQPVRELQIFDPDLGGNQALAAAATIEDTRRVWWLTPSIKVGSGFAERRGRDVFVRSLNFSLFVFPDTTVPANFRDIEMYVYIYLDTQVNGGTLPLPADIRTKETEFTASYTNLDNLKRFKLLAKKKKNLTYKNGPSTVIYPQCSVDIYLKKRISMRYMTGSVLGGNYSELDYGGILLMVEFRSQSQDLYNGGTIYKAKLQTRMTFTS